MEEVNHFAHPEHPLKLIENWNEGGDDEEKGDDVRCFACEEPISSSDSAYACTECRFFLHKSCAQLPLTIYHPSIFQHPLKLINVRTTGSKDFTCDVCRLESLTHGLCYVESDEPVYTFCINCCAIESARKSEVNAIKEEAMVKLKHKGHPQHTLTLQSRPGAILCDACKTEEKDLFYLCDSCDFYIHKGCTNLAPTLNLPQHPKHSLFLVYSLPENFYNYPYYCEFCDIYIRRNDWLYHCANCRYFTHIKCALNAKPPTAPRDDPITSATNEDSFPMAYAFTDPLKLLHLEKLSLDNNDEVEITHPSHDHPLILTSKPECNNRPDDIDSIEVCCVCVRPLSLPYYRCCKDGCSFTLHKYCANLPLTLKHQLHPDHSLDLVDTSGHKYFYKCTGCFSYGNTFVYRCETCDFHLCVNCAYLPNIIKHKTHNHPLIQVIDPQPSCKACAKWSTCISYACKACDFQLDMHCAMRLPISLGHRFCRGHEIPLTYPPVEDHPEDFYCDTCEMEMHPKRPLYHCHDCKNSFHLDCLSPRDYYANIFLKGNRNVSYHKHPLTFVRRQKGTPNQSRESTLIVDENILMHQMRVIFTFRMNKNLSNQKVVCIFSKINIQTDHIKDLTFGVERMEEINHFAHQKHPLKLIENWNESGDDEENGDVVRCFGCEEPISSSGSAYACTKCRFFLHKSCAQLPLTINLPSIYHHPLTLTNFTTRGIPFFTCDVCYQRVSTHGLYYLFTKPDGDTYTVCINCCVVESARKSEADAIKEEAMVKLKHKGHPQHTLTLQLRPGAILCDACKTEEKDLFYLCDSCDFYIHKGCTTLAPTLNLPHHPKHSLVLVYSLPDHFFNYPQYCEFCKGRLLLQECVISEDPSTSAANEDTNDLLHFPMSVPFTDPLKLLHPKQLSLDNNDEAEITHPSHDHPLILTAKPQDNNIPDVSDPIEVCYVCVRPLSFPYYRCCKVGCSFTLHKYCAQLPLTLKHQLHPDHSLDLVDTWEDEYFYKCTGCYNFGNTFVYKCETCGFHLCVNCAYLPNIIKHKTHNHPLIQVIDPQPKCKACDKLCSGMSYACKACDFQLCMFCAMRSPLSLGHRFCRGHEIPLTYPPVEDHPEDFYCDICEMEMHPKRPLYHCHDCKNSFHLDCLSPVDFFANIFYKGTEIVSYHKHPLTYVRRQKGTPKWFIWSLNVEQGYVISVSALNVIIKIGE
ncbi:C1-like protein [Artemisia annua]|uniref:C1-like protein n=1 Tax=Artemisia annua TaxID=35608 RepID=A0A2U1LN98_ARTAN|nr:C1-like protein [Artemisia annua]